MAAKNILRRLWGTIGSGHFLNYPTLWVCSGFSRWRVFTATSFPPRCKGLFLFISFRSTTLQLFIHPSQGQLAHGSPSSSSFPSTFVLSVTVGALIITSVGCSSRYLVVRAAPPRTFPSFGNTRSSISPPSHASERNTLFGLRRR